MIAITLVRNLGQDFQQSVWSIEDLNLKIDVGGSNILSTKVHHSIDTIYTLLILSMTIGIYDYPTKTKLLVTLNFHHARELLRHVASSI